MPQWPMLVKACLNGPRLPHEHARLPVTPNQLAAAAESVVRLGVSALHVHPKRANGEDTLDEPEVSAAVRAIRATVPTVAVGVTTGAWTLPAATDRVRAIEGWADLPDFASVNWHEPGAEAVAEALLARGIGVEAGLWHEEAVAQWLAWSRRRECVRILLEVIGASDDGMQAAHRLLRAAGDADGVPLLLHGEGRSAWPVLRTACARGLDVRIGLEDTLHLPDGTQAHDNADLVRAALAITSAIRS